MNFDCDVDLREECKCYVTALQTYCPVSNSLFFGSSCRPPAFLPQHVKQPGSRQQRYTSTYFGSIEPVVC